MQLIKETIPGAEPFIANGDIYLEAGHLCIKKNLADRIFGDGKIVVSVYYAGERSFLMAPPEEELFRKIHKVSQQILKTKNAVGDRSLTLQELLLDNDIDPGNRDLEFVAEESLRIIKVKL